VHRPRHRLSALIGPSGPRAGPPIGLGGDGAHPEDERVQGRTNRLPWRRPEGGGPNRRAAETHSAHQADGGLRDCVQLVAQHVHVCTPTADPCLVRRGVHAWHTACSSPGAGGGHGASASCAFRGANRSNARVRYRSSRSKRAVPGLRDPVSDRRGDSLRGFGLFPGRRRILPSLPSRRR